MEEKEKLFSAISSFCEIQKPYWQQKASLKIFSVLKFYSFLWQIYSKSEGLIPPSAMQLMYRGVKECLKIFYKEANFDKFIRESDYLSTTLAHECFIKSMLQGYCDVLREFAPISTIKSESKSFTLYPDQTIQAEMSDVRADFNYLNSSVFENACAWVLEAQEKSEDEGKFDFFFNIYKLQIENCGFSHKAKFKGVAFASFIAALLFLAIKAQYYATDCSSAKNACPLYEISFLKREFFNFVNKNQKLIDADIADLNPSTQDVLWDFFTLNKENYQKMRDVIYPDYFFIQLSEKFYTQITKSNPYDYTGMFQNLCRALSVCFPDDFNKNMHNREKYMFQKMKKELEPKYQVVKGFKIKQDDKELTDIDTAIFDPQNQTAYFVQFKYQDEFINDYKKKISKNKNLKNMIQSWFDAISVWRVDDIAAFLKSVGIKNIKKEKGLKIRYIVFSQYNISQISTISAPKEAIFVSDSRFYYTYKQLRDLDRLFFEVQKENSNTPAAYEPKSETVELGEYRMNIDYSHLGFYETADINRNIEWVYGRMSSGCFEGVV